MYREKSDSRQYSICTICRRTDHCRGSCEGFMQGVKDVTKQAFIKSIPIMCSYVFVSMAYGMMMENAGFAWYYSLFTSLTVYTGAFQFVLITFGLRALPFLVFQEGKELPDKIKRLGMVLPSSITAVSYKWKHNTLISILLGTVSYMLFLHFFG